MNAKKYTMLCLGDSYTIGEAVAEQDRFPNQTVALLKKEGINFETPLIIAKTGWTTDELATAIKERDVKGTYDFVTLLIGVNNEYRGRSTDNYRTEFKELLATAIKYADNKPQHVYVISIPDWGVTPFATGDPAKRTPEKIGQEIDEFNRINREITLAEKANYIDITPGSRKAAADGSLLAEDKLHPSAKMYAEWAQQLAEKLKEAVTSGR